MEKSLFCIRYKCIQWDSAWWKMSFKCLHLKSQCMRSLMCPEVSLQSTENVQWVPHSLVSYISLKRQSRNQHYGKVIFYPLIFVVLENDQMIENYFSATLFFSRSLWSWICMYYLQIKFHLHMWRYHIYYYI